MRTSTCQVIQKPKDPRPFLDHGQLNFSAHQVGWIVSAFFAITGISASIWLINKHLIFYSRPQEQRQIVRILFMVPIYSVASFGSYLFWNQSIYWELLRDCYEAFIIYSFFYLMLTCVAKKPGELKEFFRHVNIDKWMFPLGWVSYRPKSGMDFLWLMKWCILQYTVLRPSTTLIAVVTQYHGLYCLGSYNPKYSHVWMTTIVSISVSVAMFCIFQLFLVVKDRLKPYGMVLKLFSVKAIVFIIFWQGVAISAIAQFGFIHESEYWSVDQIEVGISAILTCLEMSIFGFLHIKAFSYLPYRATCVALLPPEGHTEFDNSIASSSRYQKTTRWSSIRDVLDLRDLFKEMFTGSKYLGRKLRGLNGELDRQDDFEVALDRPRRQTDIEKRDSLDDLIIQEEIEMVSSESRLMLEIEDRLRRVKEMGTEDFEVVESVFETGDDESYRYEERRLILNQSNELDHRLERYIRTQPSSQNRRSTFYPRGQDLPHQTNTQHFVLTPLHLDYNPSID
ncbi:organic solute transporter Ostalpha-domain-containing protein [Melampsora americana]|nr:organic solute transporter Ostalpha-domain-containing protein [Melampsora americana]